MEPDEGKILRRLGAPLAAAVLHGAAPLALGGSLDLSEASSALVGVGALIAHTLHGIALAATGSSPVRAPVTRTRGTRGRLARRAREDATPPPRP